MKHTSKLRLLLCLPLTLLLFTKAESAIDFRKGSLEKIKETAGQEGKLYFVNFTASWCSPCKFMDDYTYTDPGLSYYVRQNYLATKVDIDAFDGVGYKQQYNIRSLPSILIFNSKGRLVGRYEESMSASKMISVLKQYDNPSNRIKTKPTYSRPPLAPKKKTTTRATPTKKVNTSPSGRTSPAKPKAKPIPQGKGLYRFEVTKQASSGYSVQIGVYGDYENVLRETAKFKNLFSEPIIVHIDKIRGKTVYRVMVGEFGAESQASRFTGTVKSKGLEGFVKDLSGLR